MTDTIGGLSAMGLAAAIFVTLGLVLLAVYAFRAGLAHRDIPQVAGTAPAVPVARPRSLGLVGALLLAAGLGLAVVAAVVGDGAAAVPGDGRPGAVRAGDCAQSWAGCESANPAP